jgi:hypothetical protein
MTCEEVKGLLIDAQVEEIPSAVRQALEKHIEGCEQCAALRSELDQLDRLFRAAPEAVPGPDLEKQFLQMLRVEEEAQKVAVRPVRRLVFWRNMAAAVVLLAAGVGIGWALSGRQIEKSDRALAARPTGNGSDTLLFSLLKEESASERIKAVNYVEEMTSPDQKVINALINTLDHDKNANVRLACLYSLARFPDNPYVREALVNSLPGQTEPIVQIVLINLLTEMKEPRVKRSLQDIISNDKTPKEVKNIAEKGLRTM